MSHQHCKVIVEIIQELKKGKLQLEFSPTVSQMANSFTDKLKTSLAKVEEDVETKNTSFSSEELKLVLKGVIVAISQRLWHRREEIFELVDSLGGQYQWTLTSNCTHYIHRID